MRPTIVAVDGPAGSGKSSICRKAATKLGWAYINTGALYRALGLVLERRKVDVENEQELKSFLKSEIPSFGWDQKRHKVIYKGEDISKELYSGDASQGASKAAKIPLLREALLPLQRDITLQSENGALVDGRDIGTVVFPDADMKLFMTASIEERAKRRWHQLEEAAKKNGTVVRETIEEITSDIAERDHRDSARGTAPLKKADDATVFDNSGLSIEEAVDKVVELIKSI